METHYYRAFISKDGFVQHIKLFQLEVLQHLMCKFIQNNLEFGLKFGIQTLANSFSFTFISEKDEYLSKSSN